MNKLIEKSMELLGLRKTAKADAERYLCWLCNGAYEDSAEFLWHLNAHKMETAK